MNRETVTQPRPESLNEPFVPAISIDRDSAIPLYQQICQPLSELIGSGWLVPGQLIEDEVAMANRLRVSRPTARRALEELVNRGLVIRRRRVGTRVAPRHVHRPLGLTSLYGFPGTMILSQEAARGAGETPEEVAAIEGEILPKMIVAGFSTVTITSVIVTGIIASRIGS